MVDPKKYLDDYKGIEPTIKACITHLEILKERTERYDGDPLRYLSLETRERFATHDYFFFEKMIEYFKVLEKLLESEEESESR